MKVALYIRVSTNQQTTENQRKELEVYCKRQGWKIAEVYDDSGVSGSTDRRPALDKMLKDATTGKFSTVVIWKIDRMARSVVNLLQTLQTLQAAGVGFVSTTQQLDTTTAYGRMVLTFLGAIAEFEKSLIVERVCSGLQRAKANGVKLGRPKVEFDLEKAVQMKKQKKTWSEISSLLNVSRATVRRMVTPLLKNPAIS
jgi:DNA invertase Pin-like site-specific DNA recombinase